MKFFYFGDIKEVNFAREAANVSRSTERLKYPVKRIPKVKPFKHNAYKNG